MRRIALLLLALLLTGCVGPPTKESDTLSDIRQLTTGFTRAGQASFSPDMRWIVYQAVPPAESEYQIYISEVRYEGSRIVGLGTPLRLTPKGSRNTSACFTPDGRSLLFATSGDRPVVESSQTVRRAGEFVWSFPRGLEVVRADNWQSAIAMPEPGKGIDLPTMPLTTFGAYSAECALNATGGLVAFASSRDRSGDVDLYAMHPDGKRVVRLTSSPGYDGGPAFSPDGKRLLFRSDRAGDGKLQIRSIKLVYDTKNELVGFSDDHILNANGYTNIAPAWFSDSRLVMYASNATGTENFELRMMRRSGKQDCRITFTDGFDGFPSFSPDGRKLLWSSKRTADGTVQLFVADFTVPPYVRMGWGESERDD
ncbi:MAG: hypothetical protein QM770_06490 [Tepidisphaeraceae bacterium]